MTFPTTNETLTNTVAVDRGELKKILIKARKWERFTTEPQKYFKTKIKDKVTQKQIIIYYDIYDLKNKPVYKDTIKIDYEAKTKAAGIAIIVSTALVEVIKESFTIYYMYKEK